MTSKGIGTILGILAAVTALFLLFVRTCACGSGMGAAYKSCQCRGYEWELYYRTPADGPRKTLCIGIVESVTCYQFMGGPEIPCPE